MVLECHEAGTGGHDLRCTHVPHLPLVEVGSASRPAATRLPSTSPVLRGTSEGLVLPQIHGYCTTHLCALTHCVANYLNIYTLLANSYIHTYIQPSLSQSILKDFPPNLSSKPLELNNNKVNLISLFLISL